MLIGGNHRVNGERLWDSLMEMSLIGPGIKGGNNRQTLTDEDRDGRLLFAKWCYDAGLTMKIDTMGNMFARFDGQDNSLPPIVMGSHLDTQPTGGKFDGVLGVLAGLEVIRTICELGIKTRHPIEVVNWTNEEGARFAPAMIASGVFAGIIEENWAKQQADSEGKIFGSELERIGFLGDEPCGQHPIKAYYELHIEQGPILEDEAVDIGIVTHGQGLKWIEITLLGKEAHTGSTPMVRRIDAGLGMSRIIDRVNDIALRYPPHAVGAIGMANIYPNSRNIIPGKAVFTIDFRHPDKQIIEAMVDTLLLEAKKIANDLRLEFSWQEVGGFNPTTFDSDCVDNIRSAAKRLGYSYRDIVSGAGHDACWISHVAPTAMIMCPCVDGLSHNEDETITPQWAKAGADVLLNVILEAAQVIE